MIKKVHNTENSFNDLSDKDKSNMPSRCSVKIMNNESAPASMLVASNCKQSNASNHNAENAADLALRELLQLCNNQDKHKEIKKIRVESICKLNREILGILAHTNDEILEDMAMLGEDAERDLHLDEHGIL